MNDISYRRRPGAPSSSQEDPLAQLARIVGHNDPFASLFDDGDDHDNPRRADGLRGSYGLDDDYSRAPKRSPIGVAQSRYGGSAETYEDDLRVQQRLVDEYPEDAFAPPPDYAGGVHERTAPRRGFGMVGVAIVSLLCVGGAAAYVLKGNPVIQGGGSTDENGVRIVHAPTQSAKVVPPRQDADAAEPKPATEKVVSREELPVASVPRKVVAVNVRPQGEEAAGQDLPAAPAVPPSAQINQEPRKVRTIKVTGGSNAVMGEAPAATFGSSPEPGLSLASGNLADVSQQGADGAEPSQFPDVSGSPQDTDGDQTAAVGAPEPEAEPEPPVVKPRRVTTATRATQARAAAPSRPTENADDVDAPAPPSGGAFMVQVSSQRQQADAMTSWSRIKRAHPGILGSFRPSVRKADLGERGVFYRVRVGGWSSSADAASFCSRLKTEGADCVVVKN